MKFRLFIKARSLRVAASIIGVLTVAVLAVVGLTVTAYSKDLHEHSRTDRDTSGHTHDQSHKSHNSHNQPQDTRQYSHQDKHDEHGHEATHKNNNPVISLTEAMASELSISTATVEPQLLQQQVIVYGRVTTGPEQLSHVRARYSGLITDVAANIGDSVKQGSLLAEVESNQSLTRYNVTAPIDGTVLQRHANKGEVTREQVLFTIANLDTLWAEFALYPDTHFSVKANQSLLIRHQKQTFPAKVAHIVPSADAPYRIARVKLLNTQQQFSPQQLLTAYITIHEIPVALAVEKRSLQTLNHRQGVFVKKGSDYHFTPLQLGRSDNDWVEVKAGLSAKQLYVVDNSYLLKADAEKSEAGHSH